MRVGVGRGDLGERLVPSVEVGAGGRSRGGAKGRGSGKDGGKAGDAGGLPGGGASAAEGKDGEDSDAEVTEACPLLRGVHFCSLEAHCEQVWLGCVP